MSISSVSSYSDVTSAVQTYGDSDLGEDAFLSLLVAQLEHQDPLNPQENEAFVAQLAQFSSLEQLTGVNDALDSMYLALASMNNASMTQLLGKDVRAYSDSAYYDGSGDDATVFYETEGGASSATLTVTDEDGSVVWSEELGSLDDGEGSFTWDGSTIKGGTAEEGIYTFSVEASDSDGDSVSVDTLIEGTIDGMNYESGTPTPSIYGVDIDLGDIVEVGTSSDTEEEDDQSQ